MAQVGGGRQLEAAACGITLPVEYGNHRQRSLVLRAESSAHCLCKRFRWSARLVFREEELSEEERNLVPATSVNEIALQL